MNDAEQKLNDLINEKAKLVKDGMMNQTQADHFYFTRLRAARKAFDATLFKTNLKQEEKIRRSTVEADSLELRMTDGGWTDPIFDRSSIWDAPATEMSEMGLHPETMALVIWMSENE